MATKRYVVELARLMVENALLDGRWSGRNAGRQDRRLRCLVRYAALDSWTRL